MALETLLVREEICHSIASYNRAGDGDDRTDLPNASRRMPFSTRSASTWKDERTSVRIKLRVRYFLRVQLGDLPLFACITCQPLMLSLSVRR